MATSKISFVKKVSRWGLDYDISSGFVAPENGVIHLRCTSGGDANWFYTNVGRICMQGGLSQDGVFVVRKGETFNIESTCDSTRCYAWYTPFVYD